MSFPVKELILAAGLASLAIYVQVVRLLRYRRVNAINHKFPPVNLTEEQIKKSKTKSKWNLTVLEAQEIVKVGALWDGPFVSDKALEFALFRTYGIPTISSLLYKTKQLSSKKNASRRVVDTGLLIGTFFLNSHVDFFTEDDEKVQANDGSSSRKAGAPVDPRAAIALSRMNWIHSRYKGQISNDDFLYTLGTFFLGPPRFAELYDWRPYCELEKEALYVVWSEIGRRMKLDDIPPSLAEFEEWFENYEKDYMVPNEANKAVADQTTGLFLERAPEWAKPLGLQLISCLMDERLRLAMMYPEPPEWLRTCVLKVFRFRAFLLRNVFLPRLTVGRTAIPLEIPSGFKKLPPTESVPLNAQKPRLHPLFYDFDPWYMPETTSPISLLLEKLFVAPDKRPGHGKFRPTAVGYRLEEIGPVGWEADGWRDVKAGAEAIMGSKKLDGTVWDIGVVQEGTCPMGFGGGGK